MVSRVPGYVKRNLFFEKKVTLLIIARPLPRIMSPARIGRTWGGAQAHRQASLSRGFQFWIPLEREEHVPFLSTKTTSDPSLPECKVIFPEFLINKKTHRSILLQIERWVLFYKIEICRTYTPMHLLFVSV